MEVKHYNKKDFSLDKLIEKEFGNRVVKIQDKDAINRSFIENKGEKLGEVICYSNSYTVIKY